MDKDKVTEMNKCIAEVLRTLQELDENDKEKVKELTFVYLNYIESVQCLPLLLRRKYYYIAFNIYNLLRMEGAVGREAGEFDENLKQMLRNVLSEKMVNHE